MLITVSVNGRFHAFDLAAQLGKRGLLGKLITSYPKYKVSEWGIPKEKIISIIDQEIMMRAWRTLSNQFKLKLDLNYFFNERFDKKAKELIAGDSQLLVGWSGNSLHSIRKSRKNGIKTIIERGSSHIEYQRDILREEYEMNGLIAQLPHPKYVEKELMEYAEADFISIPSLYVKKTFMGKRFPEEKLLHVPYGVDLSSFFQIPKQDKVFRIIHCGGSNLRKGVHYLLKAFYELNLPDSELWLVGSVSDEMNRFIRKYDNGKVFFKGPFPQNELYKYYSQGSVFVLMSIEEGLAMVQPQAMACGLPVICTTNTGGEDIIREGVDGFVIPIRNIEALKRKLIFLYEAPDKCIEMGQNAKERISKGFSWDNYGEKIIKVYRNILN